MGRGVTDDERAAARDDVLAERVGERDGARRLGQAVDALEVRPLGADECHERHRSAADVRREGREPVEVVLRRRAGEARVVQRSEALGVENGPGGVRMESGEKGHVASPGCPAVEVSCGYPHVCPRV